MSKLPLEGVRVLEMTVVWAGPYCTSFLADLGAEVIRVESLASFAPLTRGVRAHPTAASIATQPVFMGGYPDRQPGDRPWNRCPIFNPHARNKLSMTLDLSQPNGLEIFKDLVKVSDIFVENNVVDRMDKLGIDYAMLKELREDIIMLRMPAYGTTGPYRDYRALGVHIEGVIGHTLLRGYTDMDASANNAVYVADAAGGSHGAFAVLAALHHRRRTGKGQYIELGQAEDAMPMMGQFFMDYTMNGRNAATTGNRHPTALQGCYPCKGNERQGHDRWVCITINSDEEWRSFSSALGRPDWTGDLRFAHAPGRLEHHDEIDAHISRWTEQMDNFQVMRTLQAAGVAAGPVMDQRDAYNDPHLKERGMFQEFSQEDTGTHLYPRAPYTMSETPPDIRRGPVRLGEDNEYVYRTVLGYSEEDYARLEAEGHISMDYPEHFE